MKKSKQKIFLPVIIFLFSILFSITPIYASGAGGQSSTPGNPKQKPLNFISITLQDGSSIDKPGGIILNPKFTILFDKSVVNALVWIKSADWTGNMNCFSLYKDGGTAVPITVSKIDDTVDLSMRQTIFVEPKNPLTPGETYKLKISPDLMANNHFSTLAGTTNGQGITITFKTMGQAVAQNTNTSNSTASNTTSSSMGKMAFNNWIELGLGIVVVFWAIAEIFVRKKIKKERDNKPLV